MCKYPSKRIKQVHLLLSVVYSKQQYSRQDLSICLKHGVCSTLHEYNKYLHLHCQQQQQCSGSHQDQQKPYGWIAPQFDPQKDQYLELKREKRKRKRLVSASFYIGMHEQANPSQSEPISGFIVQQLENLRHVPCF